MASDSQHHSETQHEAGQKQGLPQLNTDSFASQLFWLALVFSFLYLTMTRSVLPRIRAVLESRESKLQHDLNAAEHAKQEAQAARSSYEAELTSAKQKSADLLQHAQREIESHLLQEQASLQRKIDTLMSDSAARIAAQHSAAMSEIKPHIAALTAQIATRFSGKAPTKAQLDKAMSQQEL